MTVSHYIWKPGQAPPAIRDHSLVKHQILGDYLRMYVSTLMKRRRGDSVLKLTIVDGFAGGGSYVDERTSEIHKGSPLIILDALREAEAEINPTSVGHRRLDAEFVCIEKNPANCQYLNAVIRSSEYASLLGERLHIRQAAFEEECDAVFESVAHRSRSRRAIFVLDQYGYSAVPLQLIRRIFEWSSKAEVILTFATDSLIDYLRNDGKCQERLCRIGIASPPPNLAELKESERHGWREVIQRWLHDELWAGSGAAFYTPFFLHSAEAHRSYWLVHLSSHPKARDVMVSLHWGPGNSFLHYGDAGLSMLGYDPRNDCSRQPVQRVFEFDGNAHKRTFEALTVQLPHRIASFKDGVAYGELFARITNETPATSDMIAKVIIERAIENDLVVLSPAGKRKRVEKHIGQDDIVLASRQRKLFLPR